MRKNGFIIIVLSFAAVSLAGPKGYLPNVGPIPLHFAPPQPRVTLYIPQLLEPIPEPVDESATEEAPTSQTDSTPTAAADPLGPQTDLIPGATNVVDVSLSASSDTNLITGPQMFLRYFTRLPGGVGEVMVPTPDFTPALPPTSMSSATYQVTKP